MNSVAFASWTISYSNFVASDTAEEIVYETTQEVLDRLKTDKDRLEQEPEYIKTIVRELIVPNMDFMTMSRLALGNHWDQLEQAKRECFSIGFKNLLVERYAHILLSYRKQDISYQSAKPFGEKDHVSVIQTLTRPNVKPLKIEYPMHPVVDSWEVIDLVIDDVSLIRTYQKIFSKEIKQNDLNSFITSFDECDV